MEKDVKMYISDTQNNNNDLFEGNGLFDIKSYDELSDVPEISELPENGILLICAVSGRFTLLSGGGFNAFSAGDCVVVRDLSDALFSKEKKSDRRAIAVLAYGSLVSGLAEMYGLSGNAIFASLDAAGDFFEISKTLASEKRSEVEKKRASLMALHRIFSKAAKALSGEPASRKNTLALMCGYIDAHIDGKFTLDELSAMFFVSKTQIFRMFKESLGVAPMQYILGKKIDYAKHLLADTDKRMVDIAEELSFTDAKHFSKTFKNYAGILPRDYKKQIRKKSLLGARTARKGSVEEE